MNELLRAKRPRLKRIILISIVSLVVIAVILYALASAKAWNTAGTAATEASSQLKKSVDTTLATNTAPASTGAALNTILKNYNTTLSLGPCKLAPIYEWQSTLPVLKDRRQSCLKTVQSVEDLAVSLKAIQTFLNEETAATSLVKQASDGTTSATDYSAAAATWQKVADDKSLITTDAFKPVGAKTIEVTSGIATAYVALADANGKQDKVAFNTAKDGLTSAYTHLSELQPAANTARFGLIDAVVKAYNNT